MIDYQAVLAAYPASVPRYTSYPTAPQFRAGKGAELMDALLQDFPVHQPVSVYLHIPFCDRLCWFCGCHTKYTLKYAPVKTYLGYLRQEIDLYAARLAVRPHLRSLHLGGGSPSLLKLRDMVALRTSLTSAFQITPDTEISIEIDPSDTNDELYDGLHALGVTRASIGIQDFDPQVQEAINRPQSFEQTRNVIERLREIGITSVNVDALYGLPLQTTARLRDTLEKCRDLDPDRVALFGYAHIPWMKKHQTMIREADLPGRFERFEQARMASRFLQKSGYSAIGIDHFAKPEDALSKAAVSGTLQRNFQGYTTDNCRTMLGFGASSIGRSDKGYVQNIVATGQYQGCVEQGQLPVLKGVTLSLDDKIRGHIIERLMCDFRICFSALENLFGERARSYRDEAMQIAALDRFGLCEFSADALTIPLPARAFTRIVAAEFDAYYNRDTARYSQAV